MGVTSSLFYNSNNSDAETLYVRVSPTDEQFTEQMERWQDVAEYLIKKLNGYTGLPISSWLQGSYKFGTQIRPASAAEEYDIDLGIYYEWEGSKTGTGYTPFYLKELVQACLEEYKANNKDDVIEVIDPPKPRCCRIRFKGGFHIDVPCYHMEPKTDFRELATENDEWEDSDPKAFYLWFKNSFDDYQRTKVRRLIQYLKTWASLKFSIADRPSSVLLTVLVAEAFATLTAEDVAADDEALFAILEVMVARLNKSTKVENPVNRLEKFSDKLSKNQWDDFLKQLNNFKNSAKVAATNTNKLEAAIMWGEVFEHFFPMPEEEEIKEGSLSKAVAIYQCNPDVEIIALAKNNASQRWVGKNALGPIPIDCDINFTLLNPERIPAGAIVEWIVRNGKGDAEYVNDLGHLAGIGFQARTQHSGYRGMHFMDCVVKQSGRIFGFRRIPVKIEGMALPRRNPLRRPAYTALNRKRWI